MRVIDAGVADAAVPDSAQPDAPTADAAAPDLAQPDAPEADTAATDRAQPDAPLADSIAPADDSALVPYPGADATITIGTAPPDPDAGVLYPPVYAFPGIAIVSQTPLFADQADYTVRIPEVGTVTYADLDGDQLTDLVINKSTALSFYLQGPAGVFRPIPGITLADQDHVNLLVVADLNQDGRADVVLSHYLGSSGNVSELEVFLQSSDGFRDTPDQHVAVGPETGVPCIDTYALLVDDMNRDGLPDLVALTRIQHGGTTSPLGCSYDTGNAQAFLQGQDGSFTLAVEFAPRENAATCKVCPRALATGDLDGDGNKDLVALQIGNFGNGGPPPDSESLIYPQRDNAFAATPAQVLAGGQVFTAVALEDVNADGLLDVLVRPDVFSSVDRYGSLGGTPGLSAVFLQKEDGTFDDARNLTLDGWLPADTDVKSQMVGIDLLDVDGDGARDWVVRRSGSSEAMYHQIAAPEALFRQESHAFASAPDVEVQRLFADLVAAAKPSVTVTLSSPDGGSSITWGDNLLDYSMADMDGDGRQDLVAAFAPFAPNVAPDPVTGTYPAAGFQANTYTDIRVHLQRPLERGLRVEVSRTDVVPGEHRLKIEATVHNLGKSAAANVHVRVLVAESPFILETDFGILSLGVEKMTEAGRKMIMDAEKRIRGEALSPDILIPRIDPDETVPLSIDVPVALVPNLTLRAVFLVVDPDTSTNLLYRRLYDFIQ
jgi:FG-GAP-like repeat